MDAVCAEVRKLEDICAEFGRGFSAVAERCITEREIIMVSLLIYASKMVEKYFFLQVLIQVVSQTNW